MKAIFGIVDFKDSLDSSGLPVGFHAIAGKGGLDDIVSQCRDFDSCFCSREDTDGFRFGYFRDGPEFRAVGNVEKFFVGFHRFAEADMGVDNHAALAGFEFDCRRRTARLATFDECQNLSLLYPVSGVHFQINHATGDS